MSTRARVFWLAANALGAAWWGWQHNAAFLALNLAGTLCFVLTELLYPERDRA